jgi:hypothetical protein
MNIHSIKIDYNEINSVNISELIVIQLLDKIISISMRISENKKIFSKIPEICYNYSKNIINNVISFNNIIYDKDEIRNIDKTIKNNTQPHIIQNSNLLHIISSNKNEKALYFQNTNNPKTNINCDKKNVFFNYLNDKNDWNICEEPKSNKYDRYTSSLINIQNYKNENKKQDMIVKEENEHKNESNKKINERKLKYYNSSENIGATSSFNALLAKIKKTNTHKTLNEIMNEFSFYSIKEDKDEINKKNLEKLLDFNQLRKDFEAQKESNKIDLKIINQKRLSILNKIKSEEEKNKKYRGKNVTKDHNGEIIFIKKIKLDKLKKEFFIPKTTSKFIKEEKKEIEINNESESGSVSEKSFKKKKKDKINLKNIIDRKKSINIKIQKNNLP